VTPATTTPFDFSSYAASQSGPCPAGYFCPFGSSYPRPCPQGQYQPSIGKSACLPCDQYHYCPFTAMAAIGPFCAEGYVCFTGSKVSMPNDFIQGRLCNQGNFCSGGKENPCPSGTFGAVKGLSQCKYCPPGYYCPAGSINPVDCPTYNYCPRGVGAPVVCPDGTYTPANQKNL